jgi:hypothetical protein
MSTSRQRTAGKRGERGYALLVVIFLGTLLLLSTMVVAPNILTEGRREKEKDMIWRGKQYTRGIKLYYRKMGRFPTSLDDLTKPKLGSIRFMRQAYKDPTNKGDGSWRLIYVGPAGQLIGSLKPRQNLQLPPAGGTGTPATALSGSAAPGQPGAPGQPSGTGQSNTSGQPGQSGTQPAGSTSGTNPPPTTGNPVSADQGDGPIPSGDTPTIMGGNIIGVGGKINKSSIIIYDKAKNYRLFEFIWDPSKDTFGVGQPGLQTGTGLGQPLGQQPGQNPTSPQQNRQPPPQNPQQ